jgi:hypothetical protein
MGKRQGKLPCEGRVETEQYGPGYLKTDNMERDRTLTKICKIISPKCEKQKKYCFSYSRKLIKSSLSNRGDLDGFLENLKNGFT